jgi:hypothetical protein
MHDNDGPSILDINLLAKTITDSIKLSTHLFHGGMRENDSKMCKIGRLDGTLAKTRSTLFLEYT